MLICCLMIQDLLIVRLFSFLLKQFVLVFLWLSGLSTHFPNMANFSTLALCSLEWALGGLTIQLPTSVVTVAIGNR